MLAALERDLEDEPFLVVGVHSPKFPNENDPDQVREAVRRYAISHPVVVDPGRRIWDEWGVNAWPTLVLVDGTGEIVAAGAGEPDARVLREALEALLDLGRREGTLDARPLPLRPEAAPAGTLAYPGKVVVAGGRIVVADTRHDEVVELERDGREVRRIGGFRHPNGLAAVGDDLYVADTGAGAIRRVTSSGVETVAEGLRSPWDLAWDGRRLFVAMAGSHQIWIHEPESGRTAPFAGTGHEVRRDGPARTAAFAQPSGLALLDGSLYVADSEISSIRAIDGLDGDPVVRTVCGSGELFGFGDRDGVGADALLQHPLGIAAGDGVLYVADSYNHKVRRVDPRSGECVTLFGAGTPERLAELVPGATLLPAAPGEPAFHEPEGLAVLDGELLVADTNNHRVVAVRLEDGARRVLAGG